MFYMKKKVNETCKQSVKVSRWTDERLVYLRNSNSIVDIDLWKSSKLWMKQNDKA